MSGFKTTQELLEETPVSRLIIRLGIPAMFGQLFNILYNIVDRIFIGKIPETGSLCLASIGVCAPALTALTAFAFMVGIGGASYMSISLGRKEERRAREIIGNAFFYDFSYIGGSNSPAFTEPGKNTILAGQQQRYVPLRRNLFYNICLRDFCIASWMWAEPVYSGTGVCKAGHVFSGTWSCGKCGS